jgi:hypothetical protein
VCDELAVVRLAELANEIAGWKIHAELRGVRGVSAAATSRTDQAASGASWRSHFAAARSSGILRISDFPALPA